MDPRSTGRQPEGGTNREGAGMTGVVELRLYKLRPGQRAAFARRFDEAILPMLARYGVEVVGAGPSLHDDDSFYLIRAFPGLAARVAALERFYGSDEWVTDHDAVVMAMIDTYNTVVVEADAGLAAAMRDAIVARR